MAYTFFLPHRQGGTGTSLLEPDYIDYAKKMIDEAGDKLVLPVDTVVAKEFSNDSESKVSENGIDGDWMGLDIGPKTIEFLQTFCRTQKPSYGTVLWAYLNSRTLQRVQMR